MNTIDIAVPKINIEITKFTLRRWNAIQSGRCMHRKRSEEKRLGNQKP